MNCGKEDGNDNVTLKHFSTLGIQRGMALSNTAQIIRDYETAGSWEFAT